MSNEIESAFFLSLCTWRKTVNSRKCTLRGEEIVKRRALFLLLRDMGMDAVQ
jgi:hypothetical protein